MAYYTNFNHHNNVNHRQRSLTLQNDQKDNYMLNRYFKSISQFDAERANYANVPIDNIDNEDHHNHQPYLSLAPQTHTKSRNQHAHRRSHSQHYCPSVCHVNDHLHNQYYNFPPTILPARSRHPSQIHETQPSHDHGHIDNFDTLALMKVCTVKGHVDSPPPMPPCRNYTVAKGHNHNLYKIMFPHNRHIRGHFTDLATGITLQPGHQVTILCIAPEDRSQFTVCFRDQHFNIPHQLTYPPQITFKHPNLPYD